MTQRPVSASIGDLKVTLRYETIASDLATVRDIVTSTGFFHDHEVDVAVELVEERLRRGDASGYYFAFVEVDGRTVAYSCFGPIACTASSYDIYWIAVQKSHQKHGIGKWLMTLTEDLIQQHGGRRIYVETSGRDEYLPTRQFYDRCHYTKAAELSDFYDEGDSKIVYVKVLSSTSGHP